MTQEPFDTATHAELGLMQGFPPPPDKRVDRRNGLMQPPHNRWAYQNMRRLMPTAPIAVADTPVHLPRRIDPAIGDLTVHREDGSPADFETFLRQTFTDSLLVIHGQEVVCERYLNGMHARQPHMMFSCTKSFVGLFAEMAIAAGLISHATPITDIVPEAANGGAFDGVRLGDVLDMTSGMTFNEDYADPDADIHEYASVMAPGPKPDNAAQNLYEYLLTLRGGPDHPGGPAFTYHTPKTDMINWVTNRVTGQDFPEAMSQRLWRKLGTEGEAFIALDGAGTVIAGGGLNATPDDLARFAVMMLAGGRFGDREVVSPAIIDRLRAGGSTQAFLNGPEAAGAMLDGHWSYRSQWWVRRTPGREAITALGIHGQWIYLDPDRQVAIVKQSSQPVSDSSYFNEYTQNAIDTVIDHLSGQ